MVKVILTKLNTLRAILEYLRRWIFKIFFNHGEGNDNWYSQIDGHFSVFFLLCLRNWIFKIFFNHDEGKDNEIIQIESHFGVSSKENFVILGEGKDNKISQLEDNFRAFSKVIFQNFL